MHNLPTHFPAPPRRVPLSLRIVNLLNGGAQIGCVVFGFGFLFFVLFGLNADFSFATFRDPAGRATGRVTRVEETGASVNEQAVQATHYEYSVAGAPFSGTSYSTGSAPAPEDRVDVEYDEDDPARSRIAGMRRAMFGPWAAALSGIVPLIGLVVLVFATRSGVRRNRLLRDGLFANGVLKDKRPTNITINRRTLWELVFEFTDRLGQRREASARTTDPARLQDEATEALLYDPNDPKRAYLLDEAPARPRFEMNGELVGRTGAAIAALIVPTIVVGGYALLFAIKYGLLRL